MKRVASMAPDELADFERRTFRDDGSGRLSAHRSQHRQHLTTTAAGPAPPETVALWVNRVATMGPDELADFEERTFRQWDRASLSAVRIEIDRRRRELAG